MKSENLRWAAFVEQSTGTLHPELNLKLESSPPSSTVTPPSVQWKKCSLDRLDHVRKITVEMSSVQFRSKRNVTQRKVRVDDAQGPAAVTGKDLQKLGSGRQARSNVIGGKKSHSSS